ncbi:MAG: GcrA family cell cycle regulator, partial [Alphaproteobacteria bacterium]
MSWTEERISALRQLWSDGLSAAEIGRRLDVSKNAVIGKAHRLGLPSRPSPIKRGKASAKKLTKTTSPTIARNK